MSVVGTTFFSIVAGAQVYAFLSAWSAAPTMAAFGPLVLPIEFVIIVVNFFGNWNAKKICTWLNGTSSAILSALVPMFYRLISTVISAATSGTLLPSHTWFGVALVFVGSLTYVTSPPSAKGQASAPPFAKDRRAWSSAPKPAKATKDKSA